MTARLRRTWRSCIERALLVAFALLTALALTGLVYPAYATAHDRAAFPRPGQLVDTVAHQLSTL